MSSQASRYTTTLAALAIITAAACIVVPAWQLLVPGPFSWHVRLPSFWQGGLEALALIGLVATGCALNRRWALAALVALPLAFYMRRHAVDVPLLIDWVYLEIVIGLGAFARRVFRLPAPDDARAYLQAFVLGFLAWSLLAWTASALDFGSIRTLRWLTLLLAVPAVCGRHAPFALYAWRRLRAQAALDRLWCGTLVAWVAILYARSSVAIGFDSLWYGLRAQYVLDPGRSVFEPLGLVSPVHYFPKLYEVFLLPVSALRNFSVIDGMTIWVFVLALLACRVIAKRIGLPTRVQWPVLALVASLPALANSTLSPKPDVISVLFVLLAADAALAFVRSRSCADAAWLLASGTLACLAKLTAIPYVGILLLATLIAAWRDRRSCSDVTPDMRVTRLGLTAAVASFVVAGFVTARTWLLTGMPTIGPDPLFQLWSALGMTLHVPAGTLTWTVPQEWSDVPTLIVDWLFRPQRLPHIVISWVGNVWLWCAILALAAWPLGRHVVAQRPSRWPLAGLIATGAVLAVGIRYMVRGSDGNYFLAALVPAILVSATAAFKRLIVAPRVFAIALACLPAFALFQASYSFISGAWMPGTRAFDLKLGRHWHDTRRLRRENLQHAGLEDIGRYLKNAAGEPHVVGYVALPAGFWLPARFEHLVTVYFSRPEYVDDPARFLRFLREEHIDYLILPKAEAPKEAANVTPAVRTAAQSLEADPEVRRVDDRDYILLDLSARHRDLSTP